MSRRTPPKSRFWQPRMIERVIEQAPAGGPSTHLGGQFGFAGWRPAPGVRSSRGGRPSHVQLDNEINGVS